MDKKKGDLSEVVLSILFSFLSLNYSAAGAGTGSAGASSAGASSAAASSAGVSTTGVSAEAVVLEVVFELPAASVVSSAVVEVSKFRSSVVGAAGAHPAITVTMAKAAIAMRLVMKVFTGSSLRWK